MRVTIWRDCLTMFTGIAAVLLVAASDLHAQENASTTISAAEKKLNELIHSELTREYPKDRAVTIDSSGLMNLAWVDPDDRSERGRSFRSVPLNRLDPVRTEIVSANRGSSSIGEMIRGLGSDGWNIFLRCSSEEECIEAKGWEMRVETLSFATEEDAEAALREIRTLINHFTKIGSPDNLLSEISEESGGKDNIDWDKFFDDVDAEIDKRKEKPSKVHVRALNQSVKIPKGNRSVDRFSDLYLENENTIVAIWAINDGFTKELIRYYAFNDVLDILKGISASGVRYNSVVLRGTFGLVDVYGRETESEVLLIKYSRQTIERINWSNFRRENLLRIADDVAMHPSFQN